MAGRPLDCLTRLPWELVERVASQLDTRCRIRLSATSRLVYSRALSSRAFWGRVEVQLPSAAAAEGAALWVLARRDALRHLVLAERAPRQGESPSAVQDRHLRTLVLLGSLAGGCLQSLAWQLAAPAHIGDWALRLPSVRSLELGFPAGGGAASSLTLTRAFSSLTALQRLLVRDAGALSLEAGCLPRGLQSLAVTGSDSRDARAIPALAAAASQITRLQCLTLGCGGAQWTLMDSPLVLERLQRFTALIQLSLSDPHGPRPSSLGRLGELAELQSLELSLGAPAPPSWLAFLRPLGALSRLTALHVHDQGLSGLPEAVWHSTALKVRQGQQESAPNGCCSLGSRVSLLSAPMLTHPPRPFAGAEPAPPPPGQRATCGPGHGARARVADGAPPRHCGSAGGAAAAGCPVQAGGAGERAGGWRGARGHQAAVRPRARARGAPMPAQPGVVHAQLGGRQHQPAPRV